MRARVLAVTACRRTWAARFETSTATTVKRTKCGDVGRARDGEGVGRRQEEEVVDERPRCHREERRPEAEAHRDADDRGQEDEVERLDPDQRLDELDDARRRQRRRATRRRKGSGRCAARTGRVRTVFDGIGSASTASPAMTWTLMPPERRTRS